MSYAFEEIRSCAGTQFDPKIVEVFLKTIAILAIGQHGIESIGDGDDPCPERNLFTTQSTWVARTIEELMVGEDDFGGFTQNGMRVSML